MWPQVLPQTRQNGLYNLVPIDAKASWGWWPCISCSPFLSHGCCPVKNRGQAVFIFVTSTVPELVCQMNGKMSPPPWVSCFMSLRLIFLILQIGIIILVSSSSWGQSSEWERQSQLAYFGKDLKKYWYYLSFFPPSIYRCNVSPVQFSHSVLSDSLRLHELQHTRLPCASPTPGAGSNSNPSSRWCHPTISSCVIPFSSCLQSFPASEFFPMSQFFTSSAQSIGVSASASVHLVNIQDWFPLG